MNSQGAAADSSNDRGNDACLPGGAGAQQAFAVLRMARAFGVPLSAAAIKAQLEGIPGVDAVRVDADRGRIHVLYDGTVAAIAMARSLVETPDAIPTSNWKRASIKTPPELTHAPLRDRGVRS